LVPNITNSTIPSDSIVLGILLQESGDSGEASAVFEQADRLEVMRLREVARGGRSWSAWDDRDDLYIDGARECQGLAANW
jgi:hypothetical protein